MISLVEFHSFITRAMPTGGVVLDLGANRGRFSQKMIRAFGADCYAVEANPHLIGEIDGKAYHYAMADHSGTIRLNISEANSLGSTIIGANDGIEVPCITLEDFVVRVGIARIDLIKVDIEGAEIGMLKASSDDFLRSIPQITIEFHDFCGITSEAELRGCLARMKSLGFSSVRFSRRGHQDTLLVNRNLVKVSAAEMFYIRHIYRNVKGLTRILRKRLLGKKWAEGYS